MTSDARPSMRAAASLCASSVGMATRTPVVSMSTTSALRKTATIEPSPSDATSTSTVSPACRPGGTASACKPIPRRPRPIDATTAEVDAGIALARLMGIPVGMATDATRPLTSSSDRADRGGANADGTERICIAVSAIFWPAPIGSVATTTSTNEPHCDGYGLPACSTTRAVMTASNSVTSQKPSCSRMRRHACRSDARLPVTRATASGPSIGERSGPTVWRGMWSWFRGDRPNGI